MPDIAGDMGEGEPNKVGPRFKQRHRGFDKPGPESAKKSVMESSFYKVAVRVELYGYDNGEHFLVPEPYV